MFSSTPLAGFEYQHTLCEHSNSRFPRKSELMFFLKEILVLPTKLSILSE
jgi:hypothetical protein